MKELWTTNPFHLVNSPFAEMGYNSSKPNIVPAHLLLATRRPSARHPLASRAASADRSACHHPSAPCTASVIARRNIRWHSPRRPLPPQATRQPSARHPLASGAASADANRCPHPLVRTSRRHYGRRFAGVGVPCPCATSAGSLHAICPPARTNTLSPCKNTFCAIVNCPLQIKPVFYFLFTSTAPPAHRIRVKSSLLRLGHSCLALPFTHLGKDIT